MDNPYQSPEVPQVGSEAKRPIAWTVLKIFAASFVGLILILLFMPQMTRGREAARRTQCKNNLKMIGLALLNYQDKYGEFPPAVLRDAEGNPLHSWRTLILPFLEQQALYNSIDLTKPWDHPVNLQASETNVAGYRCPSVSVPNGHTTYMALVGEQLALHPSRGRKMSEIEDGTTNTLFVVEVTRDRAVHWMEPLDIDAEVLLATAAEPGQSHMGGFQAVFIDGFARFLSSNTAPETLRSIATINGQETVGEF